MGRTTSLSVVLSAASGIEVGGGSAGLGPDCARNTATPPSPSQRRGTQLPCSSARQSPAPAPAAEYHQAASLCSGVRPAPGLVAHSSPVTASPRDHAHCAPPPAPPSLVPPSQREREAGSPAAAPARVICRYLVCGHTYTPAASARPLSAAPAAGC